MPALTDRASIRFILRTDPLWSVYALGDLVPPLFSQTQWFVPDLTLVLRVHGASILFAHGTASVPEALSHVQWPVHLQLQAPAFDAVAARARIVKQTPMWRMGWTGDRSGWALDDRARRLTPADVPALQRLYADGAAAGESPDFFFPSMVADGVFFGIFSEDGELAAAAGTHLYAPAEGVAAIGNVYTRRSLRGRGYGRLVTCATLANLTHVPTVGLNVRQDNATAIRVYESLGLRIHCPFFEGLAESPLTTETPG